MADLPGTYVAQLIVSDGTLASVPTTVTITVTTPNRPPVAVAGASPTTSTSGSAVTLSASGSSDPDGNPLTYAWTIASRPVGSVAGISNAGTATASFVPDVAGAYTVQLTVSDGSLSATALAGFSAVGGNSAPQFTTVAPTVGTVNAPYVYAAGATDADAGDTLTFSLVSGPNGMAVNPATGLVSWTPTVVQTGSQNAVLRVADNRGASSTQAFSVTVGSAPTPLSMSATLSPAIAAAGQTVTLTIVVGGGNGGAITRSATLDGAPLVVNASGIATFAAPASGVHRVVARAEAAPVNGSAPAAQTRDLILTITDATDTTAPVAVITSPATNSEVIKAIPVVGTASDAKLAYYQLRLRPAGATSWTELSRGTSSVTAGTLGTFDPTVLANGLYQLGLRVVDVNGRETSTQVNVEIARDLKFGQFRLSFSDIKADAPGLPLLLTRTYDSLKKDEVGDFGYGWSAAAQDISIRKTIEEGASWNVQTSGFSICLQPAVPHRVTVTLPDGGFYASRRATKLPAHSRRCRPSTSSTSLSRFRWGVATLRPPAVWRSSTRRPCCSRVARSSTSTPAAPGIRRIQVHLVRRHRLRAAQGGGRAQRHRRLRQHGQLRARRLPAQRHARHHADPRRPGPDHACHGPDRKFLSYSYNGNGELASVTDRDGRTTSFYYATTTRAAGSGDSGSTLVAHLLDSIVDPRGEVIARLRFDEYGRVSGGVDALGQTATQSFDTVTSQQRMVDRRGNATVFTLDGAGNVTKVVDALGGSTDLTYDANGNELTRRDPLGNTVTKTYDAATGKTLTETDALGRRTTTTYSAGAKDYERQNPITVTDPRGNVTTYGYPGGSEKVPNALPGSITEPLGRVTTIGSDLRGNMTSLNVAGVSKSFGYDGRGRRTSETDALGSITTYTFDDNGNELTRSVSRTVNGTPRTETTTWVYDGNNRVIQETDPTGAVRKTTYNGAGKVETTTDALNQVTRYTYDGNARLVKTEFADGSVETFAYDANGNETARTDRSGRTTRKDYDALNRLVLTTLPDGSTESIEYDAASRVTAMVSATGGRTIHEVDAAGQVTASTDASGRRTQYQYDANGNRTRNHAARRAPDQLHLRRAQPSHRDAVRRRQQAHDGLSRRRSQDQRDRHARRDPHLRLRRQGPVDQRGPERHRHADDVRLRPDWRQDLAHGRQRPPGQVEP